MSRQPPAVSSFCPECGGNLIYEISTKRYSCRSCGLYATKDQIEDIRGRVKREETETARKRRVHGEYLEWWLGKKEEK